MLIYTSYFAKLNKIPKDLIPISICGKAPEWYDGVEYKKLAPKWKFFQEWKENQDNDFYIEHFNKEVLSNLNQASVYNELEQIVKDANGCVLICYEKPEEFCHRHLVADWLEVGLNIKVKELKI